MVFLYLFYLEQFVLALLVDQVQPVLQLELLLFQVQLFLVHLPVHHQVLLFLQLVCVPDGLLVILKHLLL